MSDNDDCTTYLADHEGSALLVLAHGAGAGQHHPFMVQTARGLAARGIDVVTFDFPYMQQGRKVPDRAPVLEAFFLSIIMRVREHPLFQRRPLFIGGKSMGGRMATHLAAGAGSGGPGLRDLAGVVALGYPLHPPGKPEQLRTAHLPQITAPVLIVQGERDTFGTPSELRPVIEQMQADVSLYVVEGGDHSLKVRGRKQADVEKAYLDAISAWAAKIYSVYG